MRGRESENAGNKRKVNAVRKEREYLCSFHLG